MVGDGELVPLRAVSAFAHTLDLTYDLYSIIHDFVHALVLYFDLIDLIQFIVFHTSI